MRVPGKATYKGDQTHVVGVLTAETTYKTYITAEEATYHADTDTTEVWFRNSTVEDMERFNARN